MPGRSSSAKAQALKPKVKDLFQRSEGNEAKRFPLIATTGKRCDENR
jgi:hypothetical protein